jgi:hypothetical protein
MILLTGCQLYPIGNRDTWGMPDTEEEISLYIKDVSPLHAASNMIICKVSQHTHSVISFSMGVETRGSWGQAGLSGGRGASAIDGVGLVV